MGMYGYFALMSTRYRKVVRPFAIYITLSQLLQMVIGIWVTISAVVYQISGLECDVNKTNSILGLLMYASYFVLFFKLLVDNYCLKKRYCRGDLGAEAAAVQKPTSLSEATEVKKEK